MRWAAHLQNYDPGANSRDGLTGLVFDIQRFAIHDGSGIRTLVFLKGCPLRCLWCQNPESMVREPEIVYVANNCIDCRKCLAACTESAVHESTDQKRVIDRARCTLCGECLRRVYAGALNIIGRYLTVSEVLDEVDRDRKFYQHSGGGVTFSGGEPTAQPVFLEEACRQAQARHLHTAIETCGHARWETFASILRYVNLVLYDVKHMDSNEHRRLTGVPNELILDNLRRTVSAAVSVRVRLPLIPGYNDSVENVRATAAFIARLPNVQGFDILPYHRLGEPKWRQLDHSYKLHGVLPSTREHVYELADIATQYGVEVTVGG